MQNTLSYIANTLKSNIRIYLQKISMCIPQNLKLNTRIRIILQHNTTVLQWRNGIMRQTSEMFLHAWTPWRRARKKQEATLGGSMGEGRHWGVLGGSKWEGGSCVGREFVGREHEFEHWVLFSNHRSNLLLR